MLERKRGAHTNAKMVTSEWSQLLTTCNKQVGVTYRRDELSRKKNKKKPIEEMSSWQKCLVQSQFILETGQCP